MVFSRSRLDYFVSLPRAWRLAAFLMTAGFGTASAQTVNVSLTTPTRTYASTGGTITVTANISYSNQPTALGGTIFLPAGWSLASVGGPDVPNSSPPGGSTSQLDFAYFSFPAGSAQFTVTLNYPAGLTGNQTLTSSFQYRSPTQNFTPAPIVLTPRLVAVQAMANPSLVVGSAATPFAPVTASGGSAPYTFAINPALSAGMAFNISTGTITGTPTAAFAGTSYTVTVTDSLGAQASQSFNLSASSGLVITEQPRNASAAIGGNVTLNVTAGGAPGPTYQWRRNGAVMANATGASLTLANFQVSDVGSYTVDVTSGATTLRSQAAVVGLVSTAKAAGTAYEFAANIVHGLTGNTYDQVLLTGSAAGAAATVTADPGQITRISYIDLNDDIVQVEFSGAGTLTLSLENPSGPALPVKYNQAVQYMKGHASVFITGADETTNVSVFTVGTATAVNQDLFPAGMTYDGVADIGLLSIASPTGKFAGIRTANTGYLRTAGLTGIYAPGVAVQGPTFVGDITADADATGVMMFASTTDVRVTGGDLAQTNGRAVQVDGISTIQFSAGTKSNGSTLPAQSNQARLERNGVDVTSQLVPP